MKSVNPRMLLVLASLLAILTLVACSSGKKGAQSTPEGTPQATVIPLDPLPTVEGRTVTSPAKGYRVSYPENWEPRFNIANTPTQRLDAFFAPSTDSTVFQATMTITCETITSSVNSQAFFDQKVEVARKFASGELSAPETLSISGIPAFRVRYLQKLQSGEELAKVDIFAANKSCGYTISLTSSQGELASNLAAFEGFVGSLAFQ